MTENLQADGVQSRQAVVVRCCLNTIIDNAENIEDILLNFENRRETYENTKQEVNNALSGFAEKEDYRGMVDYVTGITSNTDDGLYDAKSQAINEYFKELTSVEHEDNEDVLDNEDDGLDEEDEKVFRGFAEEFALRNAEAGVKAIEDAQGVENDIADSGYEGNELITDDKELHQKLSLQIVLNRFATGKTVRAFDTAAKLILGGNGKGLTIDKPKAVADYKNIVQNNHNRGKHNPVVSQLNNILNKKP